MGVKQKSPCGRNSAQRKARGELPNVPLTDHEMLSRYGAGAGGSNGYHGRGAPFFDFVEQLVVQVVQDVLAAQGQMINGTGDLHQLRDISTDEVIRPRDLPRVTGLSRTTIHRLRKAGQFVPHIKLSSGAIGFSREMIREWLRAREGDST